MSETNREKLKDLIGRPVSVKVPSGERIEQELLAADDKAIVTGSLQYPFELRILPPDAEVAPVERTGFVSLTGRAGYHYNLTEAIRVRSLKFQNYENFWEALLLSMKSIESGGWDDEMVDMFFRTWTNYLEFAFKSFGNDDISDEQRNDGIKILLERDERLSDFFLNSSFDGLSVYGLKELVNSVLLLGLENCADNLADHLRLCRKNISDRNPLDVPEKFEERYADFIALYVLEMRLALFGVLSTRGNGSAKNSLPERNLKALKASIEGRLRQLGNNSDFTRLLKRVTEEIASIFDTFHKRLKSNNVNASGSSVGGSRRKALYSLLRNRADSRNLRFNNAKNGGIKNLNDALWGYIHIFRVLPQLFVPSESVWAINDAWYLISKIVEIHAKKLRIEPKKREKYLDRLKGLGVPFTESDVEYCSHWAALLRLMENMYSLGFRSELLPLISRFMNVDSVTPLRDSENKESVSGALKWKWGKTGIEIAVEAKDRKTAELLMKTMEKLKNDVGVKDAKKELEDLRDNIGRISDMYDVSEKTLKWLLYGIDRLSASDRIKRRNLVMDKLSIIREGKMVYEWSRSYLGLVFDCMRRFMTPGEKLYKDLHSKLDKDMYKKCLDLMPCWTNPTGWIRINRSEQGLQLYTQLYRSFPDAYDHHVANKRNRQDKNVWKNDNKDYLNEVKAVCVYLKYIGVDKRDLEPYVTLMVDSEKDVTDPYHFETLRNFFEERGLKDFRLIDDLHTEVMSQNVKKCQRWCLMNYYLKYSVIFISTMKYLGLEKERWLHEFLITGLNEHTAYFTKLNGPGYKNPGVARLYEFLADNTEDEGKRHGLLNEGLKYVNPYYNGMEAPVYASIKGKLDELGLSPLKKLQGRHHPRATASLWSRFSNGALKYVIHGGQGKPDMSFQEYFEKYMLADFDETVSNIRRLGYVMPDKLYSHISDFLNGPYRNMVERYDGNPFDSGIDSNIDAINEFKDSIRFVKDKVANTGAVKRFMLKCLEVESLPEWIDVDEFEGIDFYGNPTNFKEIISHIREAFRNRTDDRKLKIKVERSKALRPLTDTFDVDNPGNADLKIKWFRISFIDEGKSGSPSAGRIETLGGDIGEIVKKCAGYCDYVIRNPEHENPDSPTGKPGTAVYSILESGPLSAGPDSKKFVAGVKRTWEDKECEGFTHEFTFYNVDTNVDTFLKSTVAAKA